MPEPKNSRFTTDFHDLPEPSKWHIVVGEIQSIREHISAFHEMASSWTKSLTDIATSLNGNQYGAEGMRTRIDNLERDVKELKNQADAQRQKSVYFDILRFIATAVVGAAIVKIIETL